MFSKSPEEFAKFKALDLEAWRVIVEGLAAVHSFAPERAEQARQISRELGGLPLSLDIAGAFIKGTSTSYEHSVATAFALAFKQTAAADTKKQSLFSIKRWNF